MDNRSEQAMKVSMVSIAVNLLLSLGKLAAGLIAHSGAMVSDAVHSASDIFSTVVVVIGVKLSGKAADREHPFGHERLECVAAIVLAVILLITGLFIGLAGARMGLTVLDPLASVVICAFIAKAAFDIFRDAVNKMVDHSADAATEAAIRACVAGHAEVKRIDLLRTREFGNKLYIDLEIAMDKSLTLAQAHAVAEDVHDDVERAFPQVKHIMIHVNPA